MKVNVSFETTIEGDFNDTIYITTEDGREPYALHLNAMKPAPDIKYEPLVKFEAVTLDQEVKQKIKFKNEGSLAGRVALAEETKREKVRISIDEPNFELQPGEEKFVEFSLRASEAEPINSRISVKVEGQQASLKSIQV